MLFKALHNTSEWALEIDSRQACFHCFFAGVVAKGVHRYVLLALSPLSSMSIIPNVIRAHHFSPSRLSPLCSLSRMLFGLITSRPLALSPLSSMSIIPNVIRAHHFSPLCPLPRITFGYIVPRYQITFGYIVPRYQSSLAVPSASKSFERAMCCFARNKLLVYVVCVVDISLRHLFCLCQWSGNYSCL